MREKDMTSSLRAHMWDMEAKKKKKSSIWGGAGMDLKDARMPFIIIFGPRVSILPLC